MKRICKVVLGHKDDLREKFADKVQPYQQVRVFIHVLGFSFEDTDKVLLHVLKPQNCNFNHFLDHIIKYISGDENADHDYKNISGISQ